MGRLAEIEGRKQQKKADMDTIRKSENTARLDFLYRKVWCLKSEVQCLDCREKIR
jgi:hypothetical protein